MSHPSYLTWDKITGEIKGYSLEDYLLGKIPEEAWLISTRRVALDQIKNDTIVVSTCFDPFFHRNGKQFHTAVFQGNFKGHHFDQRNVPQHVCLEETYSTTVEEAKEVHRNFVERYV